ncbi:MAG: hypothetical protein KC549_03080, partial [Myxococcales bacterium]|nr:hypothetical protein [Myxococcales bacterium]
ALLAELEAPPPELVERVEARATALAERQAALAALSRDHDLSVNRRQRLRWVWAIGFAWIVWNFAAGALHRSGLVQFTYTHLIGMSVVTLGLFGAGTWLVRRTLRQVAVDRQIIDMVGAGLSVVMLLWIAGATLGLPLMSTVALSMPLYVLFMAIATLTVETRLRWVPFALAPLTILAGVFPDFSFEFGGLAGFGIAVPTAIIWARGGEKKSPGPGAG